MPFYTYCNFICSVNFEFHFFLLVLMKCVMKLNYYYYPSSSHCNVKHYSIQKGVRITDVYAFRISDFLRISKSYTD